MCPQWATLAKSHGRSAITVLESPLSLSPVRIGPIDGPDPTRTLANEAIDWAEDYLLQPDGPDAGSPWRFTSEQVRFLLNWYAIDETGRFVYRSGVYRRMKGAGKNPFGAAICAIEFVGPCRFGGWDGDLPIVVPHHASWVQTAAVAKDQTRNTMTLFPAMFSKELISAYGVEMGKELIYAHNARCRIESITSSPRAIEGGRATFILRDETHHWLANNEGHAMAEVIERNAAKSREGASRVLSITNGHNPGEDSVGQRDYDAYMKIVTGKSRATGFLYDSIEAPPETDLKDVPSLRAGLVAARGDSIWLDVDRLVGEILDPRTDPSTARRYYLNQIVAAEDAWVAPHEWDACTLDQEVEIGEEITLGFDGSKSDDHTALVGCRVSDGHLFTLGIWDPADYPDGEVPSVAVDAAVRQAFASYLVDGFFSDYSPWESYVDAWERDFGDGLYVLATARHAIAWDLRGRTREATQAVEAFHNAIVERVLTHTDDKAAAQYVYNARRRPNQYGVSFGKEHRESSRKVDWLSAAVLARLARQNYLLLPENKRRRRKSGRAMFV